MSLSHVDEQGRARMVNVSAKPETERSATAEAVVRMDPATVALINSHGLAKGDVLTVAKIAGILGAKQTPALIPMCHPLPLSDVKVDLEATGDCVTIRGRAGARAPTGVEMEALAAVTIAALTVYDMCKAVDK